MSQHALVTGGAGFIGSHLVDQLLAQGDWVTVIDNFDDNYDVSYKRHNICHHRASPRYRLVEADVRNAGLLEAQLTDTYDVVVHLAARVGARQSLHDTLRYQDVNVGGTQVLLEFARRRSIPQFVFASSDSVYGTAPALPWREDQVLPPPSSPYASAKGSAERLGRAYSDRFGLRFLALRIFTVYGPRQRPDMAIRTFATAMLRGDPLPIHGDGTSRRDYTYIGDIVSGLVAAMEYSGSLYEAINLGNGRATTLLELAHTLAASFGRSARLDRHPWPAGKVPQTWASIEKAKTLLGYRPQTTLPDGLARVFASERDSYTPSVATARGVEVPVTHSPVFDGMEAGALATVASVAIPAGGLLGQPPARGHHGRNVAAMTSLELMQSEDDFPMAAKCWSC